MSRYNFNVSFISIFINTSNVHTFKMTCWKCSASTTSLKISILFFIVIFALHVFGYALPLWSRIRPSEDSNYSNVQVDIGLWKTCVTSNDTVSCTSIISTRVSATAVLGAVKALETIGLVGLVISGVISCIALFKKQNNTTKAFNTITALCSGVCIVTGVILYETEYHADFFSNYMGTSYNAELSTSCILCTIAGVLCILWFPTLLLVDLKRQQAPTDRQQSLMSAQSEDIEQSL